MFAAPYVITFVIIIIIIIIIIVVVVVVVNTACPLKLCVLSIIILVC